jgi:hypothetical protein
MSDPLSASDALAGRLADIERRFAGFKDDLASPGRLEEVMGRLDGRLPGPPA